MKRSTELALIKGADLWLACIIMLSATGHHVPWYLWVMLGVEVFAGIILRIKEQ